MRKYIDKIMAIIAVSIVCILLMSDKVHAGLQANKDGTSLVSTTASDFFAMIKGIETGALGKSEKNATDGVDCHMAKNTEWGGAAILAASGEFGIIPTANTDNSTTGNASGIYQLAGGKYEYTANYIKGNTQNFASNITNAAAKYKNEYASSSSRIAGDALNLGSLADAWWANWPVVARGYGSLFGYLGDNGYKGGGTANADIGSRAAVVCGSGL